MGGGSTLTVSLTVKRHFYTSQYLSSGKVNPVVISGGAPFTRVTIFWRRSFLVQTLPNAQRTQGIEYFESFNNFSSRQKLQQALKSLVVALLNLSVLGFSFVVFHDKAKRTQQGNLLWNLGQTSAWFCMANGEKKIEQLWQIHWATKQQIHNTI